MTPTHVPVRRRPRTPGQRRLARHRQVDRAVDRDAYLTRLLRAKASGGPIPQGFVDVGYVIYNPPSAEVLKKAGIRINDLIQPRGDAAGGLIPPVDTQRTRKVVWYKNAAGKLWGLL